MNFTHVFQALYTRQKRRNETEIESRIEASIISTRTATSFLNSIKLAPRIANALVTATIYLKNIAIIRFSNIPLIKWRMNTDVKQWYVFVCRSIWFFTFWRIHDQAEVLASRDYKTLF